MPKNVSTAAPVSREPPDERRDETHPHLSAKQLRAIECLMSQEVGESMAAVAERAGVSRATLYRFFDEPTFVNELKSQVRSEFQRRRVLVANALIQGAIYSGPGQAAMQKLYWQMLNEVKDSVEITGRDGGPIDINATTTVSLSDLPADTLKKIRDDLRRKQQEPPAIAAGNTSPTR